MVSRRLLPLLLAAFLALTQVAVRAGATDPCSCCGTPGCACAVAARGSAACCDCDGAEPTDRGAPAAELSVKVDDVLAVGSGDPHRHGAWTTGQENLPRVDPGLASRPPAYLVDCALLR